MIHEVVVDDDLWTDDDDDRAHIIRRWRMRDSSLQGFQRAREL